MTDDRPDEPHIETEHVAPQAQGWRADGHVHFSLLLGGGEITARFPFSAAKSGNEAVAQAADLLRTAAQIMLGQAEDLIVSDRNGAPAGARNEGP